MNEWQKIETAPKDGGPILGWDGEDVEVMHLGRHGWTMCDGEYAATPTHWMPLPEPPHD
jgi:hypothetical protein